MFNKIRAFLHTFAVSKNGEFVRKRSLRFSKRRRSRVHRVNSKKCKTTRTRRMDSYQMAVNVNESTVDENAEGCDKNPVCSTCSLSGHCSTSTGYYSYYSEEIINNTEKLIEREIDGSDETRSPKKVVDSAECQSASISCSPPTNDETAVSPKSNIAHLHISKNSYRMKVDNLRFDDSQSSQFYAHIRKVINSRAFYDNFSPIGGSC